MNPSNSECELQSLQLHAGAKLSYESLFDDSFQAHNERHHR